jgi:hypothetical protein
MTVQNNAASDILMLQYGVVAGHEAATEGFDAAISAYHTAGGSGCAFQHEDTAEQKELLCVAIDALNGTIIDGETHEEMTKDEAKAYVRGQS